MTKKELEQENDLLRRTINPNTLEKMMLRGEISVGKGIPNWRWNDEFGLDRLLSNIKVGNCMPSKRFQSWMIEHKDYIDKVYKQG